MASQVALGKAISKTLIDQIKVRGNIFAKRVKTDLDQIYCNANTPWICLRSGVKINPTNSNLGITGENYILWGGLRTTTAIREGINPGITRDDTKYAYNPVGPYAGTGTDYRGTAGDRGYRPMPGITGLSVKVRDTYGCLVEAEVKIKAWSLDDLDLLSNYYFKLGFSALLEWGHSVYVDNDGNVRAFQNADARIEDRVWFAEDRNNRTLQNIQEIISQRKEQYQGNYEGLVGIVTNFSYSFQKNGSYDCTLTILSAGSTVFGQRLPEGGSIQTDDERQEDPIEISGGTLGSIFRSITEAQLFQTVGEGIEQRHEILPEYLTGPSTIGADSSDDVYVRPWEMIEACVFDGENIKLSKHVAFDGLKALDKLPEIQSKLAESFKVVRMVVGNSTCNYVKFRDFLWMINRLAPIPGGAGFDLRTPYRFVSFAGMSSLNPRIAVIIYTNPGGEASEFLDSGITKLQEEYFSGVDQTDEAGVSGTDGWNVIGNIYLNIEYLSSILGSMGSEDTLSVGDFLAKIFMDLDTALGGIVDFDFHRSDSNATVAIVDRYHIGSQDNIEDAVLPTTGLRSTLLDLQVASNITNDIANEFAIAASARDTGNASYQAISRLIYLKGNATDLHSVVEDVTVTETKPDLKTFKEGLREAYTLLRGEVPEESDNPSIRTNIDNTTIDEWSKKIGPSGRLFYNKAASKQLASASSGIGALQNGVIPVKVSFTMKGISGFLVGTCFKVEPGLVSRDYDTWGYIVTGVEHTVSTRGWETSIRTQYYPIIK